MKNGVSRSNSSSDSDSYSDDASGSSEKGDEPNFRVNDTSSNSGSSSS